MLQCLLLTSMGERVLQIVFCLLHNQDLNEFLHGCIVYNFLCEIKFSQMS